MVALRPNSSKKHLKFWQSSFIYTLIRSVPLLTSRLSASNFQTLIAGTRHPMILSLMQRFMGYPLTLKKFDFDVSLDINGRLRQKSKDVMYMIITLPEAKSLLILSCPLFCFRKRIFVQFFFRS